MTSTLRLASAVACVLVTVPLAARAQDQPPGDRLTAFQTAVACAPPPITTVPGSATLHVIGTQAPIPRSIFSEKDLIILDGGTAKGVLLSQEYFVRRPVSAGMYTANSKGRTVQTRAWVRIVAANETTAIALVEHVCGWIEVGDYLEPFAAPIVPEQAAQIDRSGELDFKALGRVLYGDDERATGGIGEFMLVDVGGAQPTEPGARYAIYRDVHMWAYNMAGTATAPVAPLPLSPIGEGVIVASSPSLAVLRILEARDAVQRGDVVVPRRR